MWVNSIDDVRDSLLRWYDGVARELPWRATDDPYAILVSEVMSQQTRVETVIPYWTDWMREFPSPASLAAAPEDDVMAAWAGLGYYRRARNLHRAAKRIAADYCGEVPGSYEELLHLPGVGPYTAGAVASIAHAEVVPAVDGNVTRVVSRLTQTGGDPGSAHFRREITRFARELVDPRRPGDFNQALMELGATVCTPSNPACGDCPVASVCGARLADTVAQYPPPKKAKPPRPESRITLVPLRDGRAFLRKLPPGVLLGGTWEFPTFESTDQEAAAGTLRADHDIVGEAEFVGDVEHVFSHIRMTYRVWLLRAAAGDGGGGRWVEHDGFDGVAVSAAMSKVASLVSWSR